MKNLTKLGLVVVLGSSLFFSACMGSYYVAEQPAEPVYVQPAAPYQGAVWIEGDWTYNGGRYAHGEGHWERAREGHAYVRGNWEHTNHGYRWHRGHWG